MVDLQTQYEFIKDKVDNSVLEVMKNGTFINGPSVSEFQSNLESYLNVKHVIPCANGTDALQIALMSLGLKPGDEIITSDFTFAATVEVIALLRLTPVLVDVDIDTFNIDCDKVIQAITSRTKAIIPVIYVKINFPELIYIASLCSFLGHVFPIWLKFKGGKGVATYVGILFSINILLGIIFITSWGVFFLLFRYSSLSSIIGTLSIPTYLLITDGTSSVFFFIIMFVLIFFTHRENIKRLKNKEESKTKIY